MTIRRLVQGLALSPVVALGALAGCDSSTTAALSALKIPIDFAYACEGDGVTVAPQNDETAASINDTRMCPDVAGAEGELFGVALDRQPPGLVVMQLNPAAADRGFIDADFFRPGTSSIPVGEQPIQVLRASDFSAFFVLSAGDQRIDRVVISGHDSDGLHATNTPIPLPGVPAVGLIVGDQLVVAARDARELWLVPTAATGVAKVTTVATPGHVLHLEAIPGESDAFLATFRDLPVLARLGLDGTVLAEIGVVAQCRDGLDNDSDGERDETDLDCANFDDDDESSASGFPVARAASAAPASPAAHAATPCADGVDNDGDGLTDADDGACRQAGKDELAPACDDGVDNDGDGATDTADDTCYTAFGTFEGQRPSDGPFDPAFVDAGAAGRFVYVLDERIGQVLAFAYNADQSFTRIDVNAADATPPVLRSVDFDDIGGEVTEDAAIPAIRQPALTRRGVKNIEITEGNAFSLSASQIRGELWDRIIAPPVGGGQPVVSLAPNDAEWKPSRCSPDNTSACEQPEGDDQTWMLFGANLDGRLQLIEAVRRGTPVHRLAQRVLDPAKRLMDVTAPRLTLRGRLINARGEPQEGYPFIGAAIEELLVEEVAETSPPELRRFGVWPPDDLEEAPTESWTVSYEGRIPNAFGALGRFSGDAATPTLFDAESTFCEDGVAVGDWVQITAPVASIDAALVHTLPVTLIDGTTCPTVAARNALIEVRVATVGQDHLVLDPASARLRPSLPVLDLEKIASERLSRRACEQALSDLDDVLGRPENLAATTAFAPAALPPRFAYNVRVAEAWTLVGTRSGFLHRQRWAADTGRCVIDESLDARLSGRLPERSAAVAAYAQCPPPAEQLAEDAVETLAPAATRFANPSFGLDVFPACERNADGAIVAVASQQDTSFSFALTGPQQGSALSISNSVLVTRVPMLDFRRQQVQLDASARRATILQMRLGDPKVIATFE